MRLIRCAVCTALLLGLSGGAAHAQFVDFLKSSGETLESHTGLWFGTWMTSTTPKLPIETLTRATKEAVTGGVALKVIARPGSIGRISYEHERGTTFSPAILTFYAKASRNVSLRVFRSTIPATTVVQLTTQWQKFNIDTTGKAIDWLLTFELAQAASQETSYIIDRVGLESTASPQNLGGATTGPDQDLSTSALVLGASNVSAIAQKLNNKQPFKIVSLGDGVMEGLQMDLGNGYSWTRAIKDNYVYPAVLGQMLRADYGYPNVTVNNFGGYVYTAADAISQNSVQTLLAPQLSAGDLVILELGRNDLVDGASIATFKSRVKTLIGQIKALGVTNIIYAGLTMTQGLASQSAAIRQTLQQLVTEENIAVLDLTQYALFRGVAFSWADSANQSHPDASGHMFIAKMLTTIFSGQHFNVVNVPPVTTNPPPDSGPGPSDGGVNPGSDGGVNPGSDGGSNPGSDGGTNSGSDGGTNPGSDGGVNPGSDGGVNPGSDGGVNPGSDGGVNPVGDGGGNGSFDVGFNPNPPNADGESGGGCCAIGATSPTATPILVLLALALLLGSARRRRRR